MELDPTEMTPVINRIKRAQGQLAGVLRMLEEGGATARTWSPSWRPSPERWTEPASPSSPPGSSSSWPTATARTASTSRIWRNCSSPWPKRLPHPRRCLRRRRVRLSQPPGPSTSASTTRNPGGPPSEHAQDGNGDEGHDPARVAAPSAARIDDASGSGSNEQGNR